MIHTKIKNVDLKFETESSIFSPNFIDNGTLALLSEIDFLPSDKVLDLGCGYGVVGILAGKLIGEENVIMCDISERAVEHAMINAALNGVPDIKIRLSDGYQNIEKNNLVDCNPTFPFCKRVSHFESDLQILYPKFHFCCRIPVSPDDFVL